MSGGRGTEGLPVAEVAKVSGGRGTEGLPVAV